MVFSHSGNKMNRNKLEEIREGPFKILRRISNSIYEVDNGNLRSEGNFFHSSKLTPTEKTISNVIVNTRRGGVNSLKFM